jgi:hypothetical protein
MKREILFRANRIANNRTYEGVPVKLKLYDGGFILINPGTLCQFTGYIDKAGKKVFEGDYDKYGNVVVWCQECAGWQFGGYDTESKEMFIHCNWCEGNFMFRDHIGDFESVGNVNDVKQ